MVTCDALSALCQCDLSEPSVVAVRRYSNTSYIPQGMIHSPYLDVGTFSGGITSALFRLDRLHLCWLLPISRTDVLLPHTVGKRGWRHTPISQSSYGIVWRRNTIFPIPSPCQFPCWQIIHNWEEGAQTEGGSDCHPFSTQTEGVRLPPISQTPTGQQPSQSSPRRHRSWPKGTNINKLNRTRGMQGGRHSCWIKQRPPFRRCFNRQIQWRPSNCCLNVSLQACLSTT